MCSTTDSGEACTTGAEVIQLKHAMVECIPQQELVLCSQEGELRCCPARRSGSGHCLRMASAISALLMAGELRQSVRQ